MTRPSPEEEEKERKKAILESMSPRRRQYILKKGYDKWDPFKMPKDPTDIKMNQAGHTTQILVREFLQTQSLKEYSNEYGRGAFEICLGIINNDARHKGMYDFACWYYTSLKKRGQI